MSQKVATWQPCKRYVAIFVCIVVRAVHLDVVSDLTCAAFLAAFRRFTARRGLCKILYSDNKKYFQCAEADFLGCLKVHLSLVMKWHMFLLEMV